jgi:lipopolysaccharide export system permease protein
VLLVGAVSLVVAPWAKMKSTEFIQRFEKREDLKRVAPGQFRESSSADRVFFVEGSTNGSTVVQNVFVNTDQGERGNSIVVAREGVIEADGKGGQFLVLKNGRRYQGVPGQADFQSMEFERYSMRVATRVPVLGADVPLDAMSTPALLAVKNQYTRSELLSRISAPIVCLVLILLAIPLGFVNPRAGSSANLILALLIFFTYNNLVKMVEASVKQAKIDFAVAWWPLHLIVALIVVGLFAWRLNVNNHYHPLVIINAWKRRRLLRKTHGAAAVEAR